MTHHREYAILFLNLSILLIGCVSLSNSEENNESFGDCWSNANFTCIKSMVLSPFKDIENKKEIRLMDSVVIEKIGNLTEEDLKNTRREEARGHNNIDAAQMVEYIGGFLKTHALRIDLGDLAKLRIGRSQENPDNLEIVFDTNKGNPSEGEGAIIFAISAVKLFLLKALVVSKVALLAAGFLVLRKVMNVMGSQHHPYLYAHQSVPFYHEHGMDNGLTSGYGYSNYMAGGHMAAHGYGASASGSEDLQAHFSNNIAAVQAAAAANQTAAATRKDGNKWLNKYFMTKYH
ncbi:hypothetical protein C0J52_17073 [Blattella germanica]|nr:hypothetical protein C0J52_17073 [Blattella germanica]